VAYQSEGYDVDQNTGRSGWATLTLSKIGPIPIRTHREIPTTDAIKRVILKKERTGAWFTCLVIEQSDEDLPEKPPLDEIDRTDCIGIDLGICSYIHTPDALSVEPLDLTDEYERYAHAQRSLDRKEHGSANWEKQRQTVARAKRCIKHKILDYQHKLSTWLVKTYDVVAVEDLDVKNARNVPECEKQTGCGVASLYRAVAVQRQAVRYPRRPGRTGRNHQKMFRVRRRDAQTDLDSRTFLSGVWTHRGSRSQRRRQNARVLAASQTLVTDTTFANDQHQETVRSTE
jgi:hypothetical protein